MIILYIYIYIIFVLRPVLSSLVTVLFVMMKLEGVSLELETSYSDSGRPRKKEKGKRMVDLVGLPVKISSALKPHKAKTLNPL
jgi:hypothetical protein